MPVGLYLLPNILMDSSSSNTLQASANSYSVILP